jgi:CRP-like cAMP-binding protein/glyoxylase-like metal-dependent hydrolase (beta-lactamase superfamily II)
MGTTYYLPGYTNTHRRLVLGRAVASHLKLSPPQKGRLLSILLAEKLPDGLREETFGGNPRLALAPDLFARTLRTQLGMFTSNAAVENMVHHLQPETPTLFPLASNSWLFLPCTSAFQPFLLGAQPDLVKIVPASIWKSLAGICITDPDFVGRVEPSFPVFKNLGGIVFAKKPLPFIGTASEIERIRQIVELELFGISPEALRAIIASLPDYTGESAEQLALEQSFLGIRPGFKPWDNGATPLLPLSAYLKLLTFEETTNPSILRTGRNAFLVKDQFGEYPVDFADTPPQPIIAMPRERLPEDPCTGIPDNSVYMVSTGNGMAAGITVSFIVKINGISLLIETPAYANHYLAELGLKLTDLDYIYLSHHHHDSVAMLLPEFTTDRPRLIMSPFTAAASTLKTSLLMGNTPREAVSAALNPLSIYPGQPVILGDGAKKVKLEVMNGFHSVLSTMLAVYASSDGGATWEKEVVYTGDTLGPAGLAQAVKDGVITAERMEAILNFVRDAKVVIVDAGANIIHSDPDEVIRDWQPYVTGMLKLIHNVIEDVQKAKIRKTDLASLGENHARAWTALVEKGYILEGGVLTPSFTGKREDFNLDQTTAKAQEELLFSILETALKLAREAADRLGVSGEIIPIRTLDASVAILSQVPLLRGLAPTTLLKLARGAIIQWNKRGTTLIETGDTSNDRFFIVKSGTVEVIIQEENDNERKIILGPGQVFGERMVLLGRPANATVRSLSGCELLALTRSQYENLSPTERSNILGNLLKTERMRPVLQGAFPDAPPEIINFLIMAAEEAQYNYGDYIIVERDQRIDALYIIADGDIGVWQTMERQKVKVAERNRPEIIGEGGVITGQPRNADCVVESLQATVLKVSAQTIDNLRRIFPGIELSLKQLAEQRQRGS